MSSLAGISRITNGNIQPKPKGRLPLAKQSKKHCMKQSKQTHATHDRRNRTAKPALGAVLAAITVALLGTSNAVSAGNPEIDPVYSEGNLYYMIGAHTITDPNPNLLAQAEELYILIYPINPTGSTTLGALSLPSGYQPLCNPCFHPSLKPEWVYHDHVLTGAPGLGTNGTAGEYLGPWKIIRMVYNPVVALDPNFKPIKSVADIEAAEAAGEFLPVNQGPGNPYEIDTGRVLICPFVSPHA